LDLIGDYAVEVRVEIGLEVLAVVAAAFARAPGWSARCWSDWGADCRVAGSGQERCEARGELGRVGDHCDVVGGELDQRGADGGGERLGAAVGIELASVLAGGDDDPVT
jgi:hypothetical protein